MASAAPLGQGPDDRWLDALGGTALVARYRHTCAPRLQPSVHHYCFFDSLDFNSPTLSFSPYEKKRNNQNKNQILHQISFFIFISASYQALSNATPNDPPKTRISTGPPIKAIRWRVLSSECLPKVGRRYVGDTADYPATRAQQECFPCRPSPPSPPPPSR